MLELDVECDSVLERSSVMEGELEFPDSPLSMIHYLHNHLVCVSYGYSLFIIHGTRVSRI